MPVKYPKISEELKEMFKEDQSCIKEDSDGSSKKFKDLNKKHRERLKEIIEEIGWPTISKVGKGGSQAAWVIAQHSDQDIEFQKRCLNIMKENKDDVELKDIAYLTDRVLTNQNKKQIYGTQLERKENGKLEPQSIKERDKVNERRRSVGLKPLEDYLDSVR